MVDYPDFTDRIYEMPMPTAARTLPQAPYWAVISLPPQAYGVLFVIGLGFTGEDEWVRFGERFVSEKVVFSARQNSLFEVILAVEFEANPGVLTLIARQTGYGQVIIEVGRHYYFPQGSRPVYGIIDHSGTNPQGYMMSYGVVEPMPGE